MELDWQEESVGSFLEKFGIDLNPEMGLLFFEGCRMYMNL